MKFKWQECSPPHRDRPHLRHFCCVGGFRMEVLHFSETAKAWNISLLDQDNSLRMSNSEDKFDDDDAIKRSVESVMLKMADRFFRPFVAEMVAAARSEERAACEDLISNRIKAVEKELESYSVNLREPRMAQYVDISTTKIALLTVEKLSLLDVLRAISAGKHAEVDG